MANKTSALVDLARSRELARSGAGRAARLSARLSLLEVARHVGATPTTVQRWETGKRVPHGAAAVAWVRLLDEIARAGQ